MAPHSTTYNISLGALIVILAVISQALTIQSADSPKNLARDRQGQTVKGVPAVKQYLRTFGYLKDSVSTAAAATENDDIFDDRLASAVKAYQAFNRLNTSGEIDRDTIADMMAPRCGVPDIIPSDFNGIRPHYSFLGAATPWPPEKRNKITYGFQSVETNGWLNDSVLLSVLQRSMEKWSRVTGFGFQQVPQAKGADVQIGFQGRNHTDSSPNDGHFDGPGGVLAHARPAPSSILHFDVEEDWSADVELGSGKIDLESVALHELGHVLGLGHSSVGGSVMAAKYSGVNRDLRKDDIDGIRALYKL